MLMKTCNRTERPQQLSAYYRLSTEGTERLSQQTATQPLFNKIKPAGFSAKIKTSTSEDGIIFPTKENVNTFEYLSHQTVSIDD